MDDIIRTVDLKHSFNLGKIELPVLFGIDLNIKEGEVVALCGTSGSGKSTLLKILARLLAPDTGQMLYRGQEYATIAPMEWRRKIQYLSQKPVLFSGSVEQNLRLPFTLAEIARGMTYDWVLADKYMQELGLSPEMLGQEAQTLSGGEAARITLIRSLLINPEILLLDEPTAYLDEDSRQSLLGVLRHWLLSQPGRAMMIVSHQPEDICELPNISFVDISRPVRQGGG